jgi:hypothetical protein
MRRFTILAVLLSAALIQVGCSTTSPLQQACNNGQGLNGMTPAETCQHASWSTNESTSSQTSAGAQVAEVIGIGLLVILTAGLILIVAAGEAERAQQQSGPYCNQYGYCYYPTY